MKEYEEGPPNLHIIFLNLALILVTMMKIVLQKQRRKEFPKDTKIDSQFDLQSMKKKSNVLSLTLIDILGNTYVVQHEIRLTSNTP